MGLFPVLKLILSLGVSSDPQPALKGTRLADCFWDIPSLRSCSGAENIFGMNAENYSHLKTSLGWTLKIIPNCQSHFFWMGPSTEPAHWGLLAWGDLLKHILGIFSSWCVGNPPIQLFFQSPGTTSAWHCPHFFPESAGCVHSLVCTDPHPQQIWLGKQEGVCKTSPRPSCSA